MIFSQQAVFEIKTTLTYQRLKLLQAITQETNLSMDGSQVNKKNCFSIIDVLVWQIRGDINDQELEILYDEWCKAIKITDYFQAYSGAISIDRIVEYIITKRIPVNQIDKYVQNYKQDQIVSFLDTLNFLYNSRMVYPYPIDDLEELYVGFDHDATGCFNLTLGALLYQSLELSGLIGQPSSDLKSLKENIFEFLLDLKPVNGFITIRSFKNYFIQNYQPNELPRVVEAQQILKEFLNDRDTFDDLYMLTIEEADKYLENDTMEQKQVMRNFMMENYFYLVEEIGDNPIEVEDETKFIQMTTIELSRYYGHEYLSHIRLKLNTKYLQFIARNMKKMFNQQLEWYLEAVPEIQRHLGYTNQKQTQSLSQIYQPTINNVSQENQVPIAHKPEFKQQNYFSFQQNQIQNEVKQVKIVLDKRYQRNYVSSPTKLQSEFRTPSVNKSLNESPQKVLLDLTKNVQPTMNINLKNQSPTKKQKKPPAPAPVQKSTSSFQNRKIESFDTVIQRLNKIKP